MARPITLCTRPIWRPAVGSPVLQGEGVRLDGLELGCFRRPLRGGQGGGRPAYCGKQAENPGKTRLAGVLHQQSPGGPGGIGPRRRAPQGGLAGLFRGRRRPGGRKSRGGEGMKDSARRRKSWASGVVNGFTGSSIWHLLYSFPPVPPEMIDDGFKLLAERFNPILDVFAECGVKFALEVHPTGDRLRPATRPSGRWKCSTIGRVRLQF